MAGPNPPRKIPAATSRVAIRYARLGTMIDGHYSPPPGLRKLIWTAQGNHLLHSLYLQMYHAIPIAAFRRKIRVSEAVARRC
jgi:hypothetical protein